MTTNTESTEVPDNETVQPDENPVAAEVMAAAPAPAPAPVIDISQSPYQTMHWTKLKAMVESVPGGEYVDKAQALAFLEVRRLNPAAAVAEVAPAPALAESVPDAPAPNAPIVDEALGGITLEQALAFLEAYKRANPPAPAEDADGFPKFQVLEPYVQYVNKTGSVYVQNGHKYIEGGSCIGSVKDG